MKGEEKRSTSRMIGQLSGCQQRPRNSLITETPIMILFWWRSRMGLSHTRKEFPVGWSLETIVWDHLSDCIIILWSCLHCDSVRAPRPWTKREIRSSWPQCYTSVDCNAELVPLLLLCAWKMAGCTWILSVSDFGYLLCKFTFVASRYRWNSSLLWFPLNTVHL